MENKAEDFNLNDFSKLAFDNDISWVCFRTPGAKLTTTYVQLHSVPESYQNIKDLHNKHGFVFAPFNANSSTPIKLISPDFILSGDAFHKSFSQEVINSIKNTAKNNNYSKNNNTHYEANQEEYCLQVKKIIKEIKCAKLDKVVLSRISLEPISEDFNLDDFFQSLNSKYPDAFVYLLYIPDIGFWCGASPEPILQINNKKATTVSLAGTRKVNSKIQKDWGSKELYEQELVSRYIEKTLEKFSIDKYEKDGPLTHQAGPIEHLKSTYTFPACLLKKGLAEFLNEIHPTPSVCGLPKAQSLNALKEIEKHDRDYYTGFLGPMNMNQSCNLFVNLRCMKIQEKQFAFYLGAGITADSDPEKEWEETNAKKTTLHNIIKQYSQV